MREQRQRHSNIQPYIRATDTAGNPFFLSLFGLSMLKSRALAGEDILALRYAAYLCGWQVNHHQRIREEDAPLWWRRLEEEHKIDLQGLGEELLRLPNGESISTDIAGIISRCHTDARFSSAWSNHKHIASHLSALHGRFANTRLPKYREAIESRLETILDHLDHTLQQGGVRLHEEYGLEGAMHGYEIAGKALSALAENAERKREEVAKKRADLAAKVPQAVNVVIDAAAAWWRPIGRRDAVEEALAEALRLIGEEWRVEATLIALGGIIRILNGFEDDEGRVIRPGLIKIAQQLKEKAERTVKQWREREGEFQRSWRARLQMLKHRALDFETILDSDLMEEERLEEVFTSRIASPGVVAESVERLRRFLRINPSQQDLKDFLLKEGRHVFTGTLGGSLEEEVTADPARLREVGATVRKSRPLGSVKEEVLKRWKISRQERSLTIFTVADPDHSAIKQALLTEVEDVTEGCFVSGPGDRLIALQEFWGLPVYALSSLAKYRDAYRSCLNDPAERSLHAAPRASFIPEIGEPEKKKRPQKKVRAKNSSSSNGLQQPLLEDNG